MQRDPKIDSFRGVLIIMVVLGHVIGMAKHFCSGFSSDLMEFLFKMIYVFHMPAFFWLAGMTWKSRGGESFGGFAKKKFMRLIVPYIVFGILSGAVYYCFSTDFYQSIAGRQSGYYKGEANVSMLGIALSLLHAGGLPVNGVFRANSVLWFLPAMFTTEVLYWFVDRYIRSFVAQLIIIGGVFVCGFYMPVNLPWGLSRAMSLIPYLVLARWYKEVLSDKIKYQWIVLAMLCYGIVCYFAPNHWIVHKSLYWYAIFACISVAGIFISYAIAARLAAIKWICRVGMSAMGIMLIHKFVVVGLQTKLSIVSSICNQGFIGAILIVISITTIAVAVSMAIGVAISKLCPAAIGERGKKISAEGF